VRFDGVTGGSVVQGFEGWFDLSAFNLTGSNTSTSTVGGSGSGAGKASLSLSMSLALEAGAAALYTATAQGKHFSEVDFGFTRTDPTGQSVEFFKVALQSVQLTSITSATASAGTVPQLAMGVSFGAITLEYDAQNPDGTTAATVVSWDVMANAAGGGGSTATPTSLDFVVGAAANPPSEAVSFFNPPNVSTTGSTSTGGGSGAGVTSFTAASVGLPVDASVLQDLQMVLTGRVFRNASVELFQTSATGQPTQYASYGFTNGLVRSVAIAGVNSTVSFDAASYSWTVGDQTGQFSN
jgi:type VI protein secretion system component Hcp